MFGTFKVSCSSWLYGNHNYNPKSFFFQRDPEIFICETKLQDWPTYISSVFLLKVWRKNCHDANLFCITAVKTSLLITGIVESRATFKSRKDLVECTIFEINSLLDAKRKCVRENFLSYIFDIYFLTYYFLPYFLMLGSLASKLYY